MMSLWPHPLMSAALILLWLGLQASFATGQILLAILLAWVIPFTTQSFWPRAPRRIRLRPLVGLLGSFVADVIIGSLDVARTVLLRPQKVRSDFIQVPLDTQDTTTISILMNLICLTPGTVSAWLDHERHCICVHALNADEPASLVETIKHRYERPLMETFE